MGVFLDENIPHQLRYVLADHIVSTAEAEGWKGKQNGELISLVEKTFDVFVTSDSSLLYQQSLAGRRLSLIVLPTNKLTILKANAAALMLTLAEMAGQDRVTALRSTGKDDGSPVRSMERTERSCRR